MLVTESPTPSPLIALHQSCEYFLATGDERHKRKPEEQPQSAPHIANQPPRPKYQELLFNHLVGVDPPTLPRRFGRHKPVGEPKAVLRDPVIARHIRDQFVRQLDYRLYFWTFGSFQIQPLIQKLHIEVDDFQ